MKNMGSRFFLFTLILVLTSCTVSKESVSGVYLFRDKHNPEFWEAVHLYNNGTFNFQLASMIVPYPRLKGTWQLEGRKVILTSPDVSVIDNDTLKLKNSVYEINGGNWRWYNKALKRHGVLKKIKGKFKSFKLNGEVF